MSRLNVDKITGVTGTASGAPITLSGDTATLSGTGVTFPSGLIVKTFHNEFNNSTALTATQAADGTSSNPDSLTGDNFTTSGRVFLKVVSKTVNITSGNGVIVSGWCGQRDITRSSKGGYGFVFKVPDSSGNNRAYEGGNYNHYNATDSTAYPSDWSGTIYVGPGATNSSDTVGTGDIEIAIYGYAYNEASGNDSQTMRCRRAQLIVHEVQI